jgi:hypothetical protein
MISVRLDAPKLWSYASVTVENIIRLCYSTVSGTNLFQRDLTSRPAFVSRPHYTKLTRKKENRVTRTLSPLEKPTQPVVNVMCVWPCIVGDIREKPNRCYTMVYWTYNSLNMFRAPLCPSSGAWDYTDVHSVRHMILVMAGCWRGVWL